MKTSKLLAAAALTILAAAGAQAETYEGVHAPVSTKSRAEVQAQAVAAARAENPYADGVSSRVAPALTDSADRSAIRSQAVTTAHAANQNLKREAFVNSAVPSQFKLERSATQQAGL